ncbi:MAG: type 4a pilus biogenesis protein PilO [Armatimonadota bacterium]|nr:MAG: type 4a pilus biogenesis protein PilO [Armatimonadota bacterium]
MSGGGDRKVVFALLGVAMLCMIGLGASLYHAKTGELSKLRQELEQKENQLAEVRKKLTELPTLEARYARLQARLSVLEPSLPDSAYIPTFLRQIEGLATGTRNNILMIRPKPAVQRNAAPGVTINDETGKIVHNQAGGGQPQPVAFPYDFVPIELRLEGTYWTAISFLAELQKFPKMIAVNDISFSPTQAGIGARRSPRLTATMGLTAVVTKGGNNARPG